MGEALVELLAICAVAGFIVRDALRRRGISVGHIVLFLFSSLAIVVVPGIVAPGLNAPCHQTAPKNVCINNLREIDGAKEQWAIENQIAPGAPSIPKEVNAYIKNGGPECPAGGVYTYGKVDGPPRCSIKDHTLQ